MLAHIPIKCRTSRRQEPTPKQCRYHCLSQKVLRGSHRQLRGVQGGERRHPNAAVRNQRQGPDRASQPRGGPVQARGCAVRQRPSAGGERDDHHRRRTVGVSGGTAKGAAGKSDGAAKQAGGAAGRDRPEEGEGGGRDGPEA